MIFRKVLQCAALFLAVAAVAGTAVAEEIPISLLPSPDVFSGFISVNYDATASTDNFQAVGTAFQFSYDDGNGLVVYQIPDGLFTITATIDTTGHFSAGTLSVGGTVTLPPGVTPSGTFGNSSAGSLLTGTLTNFGFAEQVDGVLQFIFMPTGGDLAGFYTEGERVLLSQIGSPSDDPDYAGFGFSGSFSSSFNSYPSGAVADVGSVPEPGTLLLFISGAGFLLFRLRRSHSA